MSEYHTITTSLTILPIGDAIYSEKATTISLEDENAGLFVVVSQDVESGNGLGKIQIMAEEWPQIRAAIEAMFIVCAKESKHSDQLR